MVAHPGMLLVHPRLHNDNGDNQKDFRNWTKLHYRDLLSMPADEATQGKATTCMRFDKCGDESRGTYSHEKKEGVKPAYVYATLVSDLAAIHNQRYYDLSRKLNLEDTRPLGEGEGPVAHSNKDASVFEVVDAQFAMYEEIQTEGDCGAEKGASFQNLPAGLTRPGEFDAGTPTCYMVAISLNVPADRANKLKETHQFLNKKLGEIKDSSFKAYTSLYHWQGTDAQPTHHPLIDTAKDSEWMIMVYVSRGKDSVTSNHGINDIIGNWVSGDAQGRLGTNVKIEWGIWERDLIMR